MYLNLLPPDLVRLDAGWVFKGQPHYNSSAAYFYTAGYRTVLCFWAEPHSRSTRLFHGQEQDEYSYTLFQL
jgi:hypothetical protein